MGKAQINFQDGELKLRIQGDEVMFYVFQVVKHPNDETNDDINETGYKESMHGYSVNCNGMIITAKKEKYEDMKKDTKGSEGVGDKCFPSTMSSALKHCADP